MQGTLDFGIGIRNVYKLLRRGLLIDDGIFSAGQVDDIAQNLVLLIVFYGIALDMYCSSLLGYKRAKSKLCANCWWHYGMRTQYHVGYSHHKSCSADNGEAVDEGSGNGWTFNGH